MGCPNAMMPNFLWDERQKKTIMERFNVWRSPMTPEEIALYKEINSKIDEYICLMSDNDEKAAKAKSKEGRTICRRRSKGTSKKEV